MSKLKFDSKTRNLFLEVQLQISKIDGQLMKSEAKLTSKTKEELQEQKTLLQTKMKELKTEYFKSVSQKVIEDSKKLVEKLNEVKVEEIFRV